MLALGLVTPYKRESVVGVPIVDRASFVPTIIGLPLCLLLQDLLLQALCCLPFAGTTVADSIVPSVVGLSLCLSL